jgi:hypothetical protein
VLLTWQPYKWRIHIPDCVTRSDRGCRTGDNSLWNSVLSTSAWKTNEWILAHFFTDRINFFYLFHTFSSKIQTQNQKQRISAKSYTGVYLDVTWSIWVREGKIRIRHRKFRIRHWRFHKGNEKFWTQQAMFLRSEMIHGLQVRIRFQINLALTWSGSVSDPEVILTGSGSLSDPRIWYATGSGQSLKTIFLKKLTILVRQPVLRIRIHMFLCLLDPDPSIIMQK